MAHLLLVEDDELVRQCLAEDLRDYYGLEVTTAGDGLAALAIATEARFDVVLTDALLPGGLDGAALAATLRALHPGLPIVAMSGYAAELPVNVRLRQAAIPLLEKPVSAAAVMAAISLQLGDGGPAPAGGQ